MALNVSIPAAREYAEALIAIGRERDQLTTIYDELMTLRGLYEDREFRGFFTSPRIDPDEKFRILRKAFDGKFSMPILGLVHVLIRKRRELLLDNIADQFQRFQDLAEGKVHVHLRSARPVEDEIRARIEKMTKEEFDQTAVIHETIDESLIGGMVLRIGDIMVDNSIRRKLEVLRKNLMAKERLF
ncbi:MAG: ATP synthase F1 subunit delta [Planctomycetota bacterium]